ncbi:MAG TPA: hypothetical protein VLZ50_13430 [Terracidiphilus sp.]|nr:hypothetical protein [Terracidiphilus sp.]
MSCLPRWMPIAAILLGLAGALGAESPSPPPALTLTAAQIVQEMEHRNELRLEELRRYTARRHYEVSYKGFGARLDAKMEVEVVYDALSGKTFRIVSQSGSKLLTDKVLKRLIEAEKAASADPSSCALAPSNYNFSLAGAEPVDGRPAYVLNVEPLTENKLLYRGRVWVDAADFAVVKVDARPARNPSAWIGNTRIYHTYARTGGFWLPQENRSESKIRIGGAAVLTIDYGAYQIQGDTLSAAALSAR